MPRMSKKRKDQVAKELKERVFAVFMEMLRGCHPDKLCVEIFSMAALAKKAGVATGTLYNYFSDKDALIAYVVRRFAKMKDNRDIATLSSDKPIREQLENIVRANLGIQEEIYRMLQILGRHKTSLAHVTESFDKLKRGMESELTEILQQGIEQGVFLDIGAEDLACELIEMINGLCINTMYLDNPSSNKKQAETLIRVFLHGALAKEKGLSLDSGDFGDIY